MNKGSIEASLVVACAIALALLTVTVLAEEMVVNAAAASDSPWYVHAAQASAALEAGATTAALKHWQDAYLAASANRRSEGLVELGDLYRRLGDHAGLGESAVMRARQCYLTALLRARNEASIDGVLRATEAFLDLRDEAMVAQGLRLAREIAKRDPDPRAGERVAMLAARAARSAATRR